MKFIKAVTIVMLGVLYATNASSEPLPTVVTSQLTELGAYCEISSETLEGKPGVVQSFDLNSDGVTDYILDGSAVGCFSACGASACQVFVFASSGAEYIRNEFLGYSVTEETFTCTPDGNCDFR